MSDAQQQQRPTPSQTPASTTPAAGSNSSSLAHPHPTSSLLPSLGSSSATIDVTEEFSNEQIDAFLSANPDFAARALDEAARGGGGAASAGWDAGAQVRTLPPPRSVHPLLPPIKRARSAGSGM